jgi:glycerate dehydrogenase
MASGIADAPIDHLDHRSHFHRMKIVVLDGYTLNPGDLDWETLQRLGECRIHDRSPSAEVLARAQNTPILLTNKVVLDKHLIHALPELKYIGVLATGTNVVDLPAAREKGIVVTNVPSYGTYSVAQATFALLLEITQSVGRHSQSVRDGNWSRAPDWCYWETPLIELRGLTLGIIGLGRIGHTVAQLGQAFGMKVLANRHGPDSSSPDGVHLMDTETVFRESDVLSLHCPLTAETENLVNKERLALMKPTAILLNTSRGGLVDEQALAHALNNGKLAAAGLDVLRKEPPAPDHPLINARNCFVTPHVAWATHAARKRLLNIAGENVRAFINGHPINVVD